MNFGKIPDGSEIHHIDGNKHNNHINNLKLLTEDEHKRLHGNENLSTIVELKCAYCEKLFFRYKNDTHLSKGTKASFCNRKCGGYFQGLSEKEKTKRMSENVVRIFKGKGSEYSLKRS